MSPVKKEMDYFRSINLPDDIDGLDREELRQLEEMKRLLQEMKNFEKRINLLFRNLSKSQKDLSTVNVKLYGVYHNREDK